MPHRPAVHLAVPVDGLAAARRFYGQVPTAPRPAGTSLVEQHAVPIPHFGLLLDEELFNEFAERLRSAGVPFGIEPYRRFPGEPGEHWTVFFRDPAGNALEFTSFRDEPMVFAR